MITRILCPVDFSLTSSKALDYACRLASSMDAELVILHALEKAVTSSAAGQGSAADKEFHDFVESALRTAGTEVVPARVQHVGPPGDVITWMAQDRSCDLIVMGTHGRTGLLRLLMGSVAENVVRTAPCPVLTLKGPHKEEE